MDNISCIATSVSPTTTIMTARPTFATNTATTAAPPPTAATNTTATNDDVDCSILNGNDNLQKPEIQYETIQLGLHEGEPTFTTIKSNESTSSLQRKKKNQCALIKKQWMQICRLMKKLVQMKDGSSRQSISSRASPDACDAPDASMLFVGGSEEHSWIMKGLYQAANWAFHHSFANFILFWICRSMERVSTSEVLGGRRRKRPGKG
ncbi:uncharacterized protein [Macrobrachium rosenbergii]|uniref:uncharacterized protein n=1 Tax=Macrobrachium rosenbergii TaxID=79674 RepID=UPI0034D3A5DA